LEELAAVAKPDTLLAWYRKLIANKFDGSKFCQRVGRPRIDEEAERLVVQMAKENPSWGYDRIVGALANLGFLLSDQTVGNILRRHGLAPAPKGKQAICWKDFIRSHMEVLVGTDFFTGGSPYRERVGYLLCPVFHSLGESAGELGRNDALPGP
jgi:putative transposase